MSIGVTLDPTKAEQSRLAAEHVATFLAGGGKIQVKADGEQAMPHTMDMHAQHNLSMKTKKNGEAKVRIDSIAKMQAITEAQYSDTSNPLIRPDNG